MMQCSLDKETPLVLAPGSASVAAPNAPCVVTVEHMEKVSKDEAAALTE